MGAFTLKPWYDVCILVVGDVMLDRHLQGTVTRVSPDAPVPVLRFGSEFEIPGGAANVARNISAMGGRATLLGCIGDDEAGERLQAMLDADPRITAEMFVTPGQPTTQKWRFGTDQQQILRVDREPADLSPPEELLVRYAQLLGSVDAVILSDYGKGALPPALLAQMLEYARCLNVPVIVDPKWPDASRYDGATLLTPNRVEAEAMSGLAGNTDQDFIAIGERLLEMQPATNAILITRGKDGMTLVQRHAPSHHISANARDVFDVSGAGDTVCAAVTLALAASHSLSEAAGIANDAAGIVVGIRGTATVSRNDLEKRRRANTVNQNEDKILSFPEMVEQADIWRKQGLRIGFTNGCFDLIHPGHISLLTQAASACDRLVVAINSDTSVRRLKGAERPVQNDLSRAMVLAAITGVDRVIIFDQDTPLSLIVALRPDLLIKGKDYAMEDIVGADVVKSWGGDVLRADRLGEHSTTGTIKRLNRSLQVLA